MPPLQPTIEILCGFGAFTRVITRGKRYEKKPIKAFVSLSKSANPAIRIGYTVTKGIRKAVQRNRIKRLMREAFRANKGNFLLRLDSRSLSEIVFMYVGTAESRPDMVRFSSINEALADLSSTIELT
jgi:RNase P protein component